MGMILRIASSRIVGQGDIVGRSGYFSLNLSANSVMRGRLDARRTLKSLVADLRFLVKKIIIIHIFILFSERTPPQKKQKYRLLILIIYTTFTSDLTSFSFRREPQGGKNRLSAKKMNFFPSAFYSH